MTHPRDVIPAERPPSKPLTHRQERFAWLLGEGGLTQVEAYIQAGFSARSAPKNAAHLANQPRMAQAIRQNKDDIRSARLEQTGLSRAWVLERLEQIVEQCLSGEKFNPAAAIRALELLGKDLGMFVERRDVTTRTLDTMSQDELAQYKAALEERKRVLLEAKARAEATPANVQADAGATD